MEKIITKNIEELKIKSDHSGRILGVVDLVEKLDIRSDIEAEFDVQVVDIVKNKPYNDIDVIIWFYLKKHSLWTDSPTVIAEGEFPIHFTGSNSDYKSGFKVGIDNIPYEPEKFYLSITAIGEKEVTWEGKWSDLSEELIKTLSGVIFRQLWILQVKLLREFFTGE